MMFDLLLRWGLANIVLFEFDAAWIFDSEDKWAVISGVGCNCMSWKGCNVCDDVSGDEHGMSKEGCASIGSWELVEREKSRTWEESDCKFIHF